MTADTLAPSIAMPTEPTLAARTAAQTTETISATTSATTFADLGVDPRAVATLARMGIETPTLIQARAIPPLLAGRDVVGQSRTGSGKTIAYGLPLIERLDPRLRRVQALVLVPTRELAGQVATVLLTLGANRGLRVAQLIGGRSYLPQREALRLGAQIAVGAPGRVLDHLRQGTLDLSQLTFAVLDEADQMLDAGFAPDVERLLYAMPDGRQLALFTATLPAMTTQIAQRHLHEPVSVDAGQPESRPAATVTQIVYTVPREHRLGALMALLDRRREASGTTLVFGRTKHGVDKLARQLVARGYPVAALHGNMSQNARDRVLADFRSGKAPMLLATNVAARGLDVLSIEQVINYELPESAELFTHRVGRTGRMDNTGEAITLLTPDDMAQWRRFQRELALKVKPQPWPLDSLPVVMPAVAPMQPAPQPAEAAQRADEGRDERRREGRSDAREWRAERPAPRRLERRPLAGERRFPRDFRHDVERGERDERRPARREDIASRWSHPASEAERRDDRRDDRENYREERPVRARDDFGSTRRDDRPTNRRFSGERDSRRDEARRPASPRRGPGGFRHAEGTAPRRPASRTRGYRPARG